MEHFFETVLSKFEVKFQAEKLELEELSAVGLSMPSLWLGLRANIDVGEDIGCTLALPLITEASNSIITENCSPNEDAEFNRFVQALYPLVTAAYQAAHSVDASTRDTGAHAATWRKATDLYVSKTSWCLSPNNPNIPTWRTYAANLETSARRIIDVMKSNFRAYRRRVSPFIITCTQAADAINSSSVSGAQLVDALKQLRGRFEDFYFGLADNEIAMEVQQLQGQVQDLSARTARATTQLLDNFGAILLKAEQEGYASVKALSLIDDPALDGAEQFDQADMKAAYYYAHIRSLQQCVLIDDNSGRVPALFARARTLIDAVNKAWKGLRRYNQLPPSNYYTMYGEQRKRYGQDALLTMIERISRQYHGIYKVKVGVGNISYEHGGTVRFKDGTGAHAEHKFGQDVDMLISNGGVYGTPGYDKVKWKEFLILCSQESIVKKIYFSDPAVAKEVNDQQGDTKVRVIGNHSDHCHVSLD